MTSLSISTTPQQDKKMEEADANELKVIADRLLQRLKRSGQVTVPRMKKIIGLYTTALEFDRRSTAILLSRASAQVDARAYNLAYVDVHEVLHIEPTCEEASALLIAMARRLVPQGVMAEQARRLHSTGRNLLKEGKSAQGIHLLANSLRLRRNVVVMLDRAVANQKRKRFELAYVDACEAVVLLDAKDRGKQKEEASKIRRSALAQLDKFKTPSHDPSLMLSKFSSWMDERSMGQESLVANRSAPPTPSFPLDASALFIMDDSARLEGPTMSPRCMRLPDLPGLLSKCDNGSLREVVIMDVQVDSKLLSIFHLVNLHCSDSLQWLMLDAVDFRRLSADDFKPLFNGGPQQRGAIFSAKTVYLYDVQMPGSFRADQLLQLNMIRDAGNLVIESKSKHTASFLLSPAAIATCLADKRPESFKLRLSKNLVAGPVAGLIDCIKKNFHEAKRRVNFQLTLLCTEEDVPDSTASNSMQETLSITTKAAGQFLYDSTGGRRVIIHRYK